MMTLISLVPWLSILMLIPLSASAAQILEESNRAMCSENKMEMIGDDWKTKLLGSTNYIQVEPRCPAGGTYSLAK